MPEGIDDSLKTIQRKLTLEGKKRVFEVLIYTIFHYFQYN
jgi:hypothetical protein